MISNEPYSFFRQVTESDLPYIAQCMGAGAGLSYTVWGKILHSLQLQFRDKENGWCPYAWILVVEDRPVFLLESIGNQLFFTGPPSWQEHSRRMMLAWHASLVHFLLRLKCEEVHIAVQEHRIEELRALEKLGCRRTGTFTDRAGTHYRLTCTAEELCPVV